MTLTRRAAVVLGGSVRWADLHRPRYSDVVELLDSESRAEDPEDFRVAELVRVVDLDEQPLSPEHARELIKDRAAYEEISRARTAFYQELLERGRIIGVCPGCGAGTELDLAFYVLALRLPSWSAVENGFIAVPQLAHPRPPSPHFTRPYDEPPVPLRGVAPRPAGFPKAARLDFVLPAAAAGLSEADDAVAGTLGDVDANAEAEAWRRWAPAGRAQPVERNHWDRAHAGFRAALRLSVALDALQLKSGASIETTPDAIERLFLADVQFLDVMYSATHALPVQAGPDGSPRGAIRCRCGAEYLPVR